MEFPPTPPYSTEIALQALSASNVFSSHEEKNTVERMSAVAGLMYKGIEDLSRVDALFPNSLVPMPTPKDLGIKLPNGLKVQAFRHQRQVIIAIRGTELNNDSTTMVSNLIADLGIGRHKSNEDLLRSLENVNVRVYSSYGFEIDKKAMDSVATLINSRVLGHNDTTRAIELSKRVGHSIMTGGTKGSIFGGVAGGTLAGIGIAAGLAAAPIGIAFAVAAVGTGFLVGGGVSAAGEMITCTTVMDGYPTLLSYISAIDAYIMKLKGSDGSKEYIQSTDTVIVVGHSLAGYLAAVTGALHGDEVYSFNGPGIVFEEEMKEIIYNLGLERKVQGLVTYNSISMATDFIGNLGKRDGNLTKLYLPITSAQTIDDLPPSKYISPLSHHGIELISGILKNSSVLQIPKNRFPDPTDKDHPRFEEIS